VAEIYALRPEDVRKAFTDNLAARERQNSAIKNTAPIFVCIDRDDKGRPAAVGSDLGAKAIWQINLPFDVPDGAQMATAPKQSNARPRETRESFAARVRRELADLVGVPVDKVTVDFRFNF
jgi:hypothetical protein